MAKRARTCPDTGVPLKDVEEHYLTDDRHVDLILWQEQLTDCNVFGLKQAAGTIFPFTSPTAAVRQFKHQLGLGASAMPTSWYHFHRIPLGIFGQEPFLYATHVDSLMAGCNSYTADAIARCTRDQSGLRRG